MKAIARAAPVARAILRNVVECSTGMKSSLAWCTLVAVATLAAGCASLASQNLPSQSTAAQAAGARPADGPITPTPEPEHLYVDHAGILSRYHLPLTSKSKPDFTINENPGGLPPQIAVDQYGNITTATATELRIFKTPIVSLARNHARTIVPFNPAITAIGASGAVLNGIAYDPYNELWLLSAVGGEVEMLQPPIAKYSVAYTRIQFGAPGSKTANYGSPEQISFDSSGNAYVYAGGGATGARLFKIAFPYSRPPSSLGVDIAAASWVDASQYFNGPPYAFSDGALIGQYTGPPASPAPLHSPAPNIEVLTQYTLPLDYITGLYPTVKTSDVVGATVPEPNRNVFYALRASTGALEVYAMPMASNAKPKLSLSCSAKTVGLCDGQSEHLFLAP
jgi:hypothetical protein